MAGDTIWKTLHDFEGAPLREGAIQLLKEFGLTSDRVIGSDGRDGSLNNFLNQFS
ncbi:hypothetical protein [Candidatus Spongiihabitans sp.]|uniref:hypothetical protein n=1 Tax=Candidatus Spongiihabitans sp. TaxID=3101308 RepID=UPI003C7B2AB2